MKIMSLRGASRMVAVFLLATIALVSLGSTFTYKYLSGNIKIYPPVVWMQSANSPNVAVSLYRGGTEAEVDVYHTARLERVRRSAIFFDNFGNNPFTETFTENRLTSFTCSWDWVSRLGAIYISTTQRGPAGWDYECMALANIDIKQLAQEGRKIYVAFLVWRDSFQTSRAIRADAVYVDTDRTGNFFRIGYNVTVQTSRNGDRVSSTILRSMTVLSHVPLGTLLTLEYRYLSQVASMIDFSSWRAEHWNVTRLNQANIPENQRLYPNRVGIGFRINATVTGRVYVYFDNLVVTVDHPPWFVNITGLPDGWKARVVARAERIVGEAIASGGVASVPVWAPQADLDQVGQIYVSTDFGFVIQSGRIEIYNAAGQRVIRQSFDYVVGGDVYAFIYGFGLPRAQPILRIVSNMSSGLYVKMDVNNVSCSPPGAMINANISIISWTGARAPSNISIRGGNLVQSTTGEIYIQPPAAWTGSWLVANVTLSSLIPRSSSCTIHASIVWRVSDGVSSIMPVKITLIEQQ